MEREGGIKWEGKWAKEGKLKGSSEKENGREEGKKRYYTFCEEERIRREKGDGKGRTKERKRWEREEEGAAEWEWDWEREKTGARGRKGLYTCCEDEGVDD